MTSEKQIAANRANAEKSTGPKTPETKAISAMNALRHGLTGQVNLMPTEDREAHDKFCAAIVESLAPEGALEIQFAHAVAEDNWRMNRGRAIETNMLVFGNLDTRTNTGQSSDRRSHNQRRRSSLRTPGNSNSSPCICSARTATCRRPSTVLPPSRPNARPAAKKISKN